MLLGLEISAGTGKYQLTKVVTISPRFVIKNNLTAQIQCRTSKVTGYVNVGANQMSPLYSVYDRHEALMSIRSQAAGYTDWSAAFGFNNLGKIYVKLVNKKAPSEILLKVEVLMEGATIFVTISQETSQWPYRIDNKSSVDVIVRQYQSRIKYKIG